MLSPPPPHLPPQVFGHFFTCNKETLPLPLRPEGSIYPAKKKVGNAFAMTVTALPGINILNTSP